MYSQIGAYTSHLCRNDEGSLVYVAVRELPDHCFVIDCNCILHTFVYYPHHNTLLHPSKDDLNYTEPASLNGCIHLLEPPVQTQNDVTPHLDTRYSCESIGNEY